VKSIAIAGLLCITVATVQISAGGPERAAVQGLLDAIESEYAYFEELKPSWPMLRSGYLAEASRAEGDYELFRLAERLALEFCDDHTQLDTHSDGSPRNLPSGSDIWPVWDDGRVIIESVRAHSAASRAGLVGGLVVTRIGGVPAAQAVREYVPEYADISDRRVMAWAVRAAVAGTVGRPIELTVLHGNRAERVSYMPDEATTARPDRPLTLETIDDGVALVRFHDSLGQDGTVAAFDEAMSRLGDARHLVIDLRDTASGGNTNVARGIMSRLVTGIRPYQIHDYPAEARRTGIERRWAEQVVPRDPVGPIEVAVLVGRWTGSMGEGLAIGLRAATGAILIGTEMAGLRGAVYDYPLGSSGIALSFPTERLFAVDGTPRESAVPDELIGTPGLSDADREALFRAVVERWSSGG